MLRSQATQEAPLHDHFLKIKGVQVGRKGWRLNSGHVSFSAHETFCLTPLLCQEWSEFSMLNAPSFPLFTSSSRSVVLKVWVRQNPPGGSFKLSFQAPVAEFLNSRSDVLLGDADVAGLRATPRELLA